MIDIYVISLKDAVERRENITKQFSAINREFEFLNAVDGRTTPHPLFKKYSPKKSITYKGYELTPGELGCFASHYLLWEKCVELNKPIVVIEDDAELEECFSDTVNELNELEQYEYIRLFVNGRKRPFIHIGKFRSHDVVEYNRGPGATRAYYITPKAAKKFIAAAQEWYLAVDDYMDQFWVNKVPCRGIMPGIVQHETDFESTIGLLNKKKKQSKVSRELYSFKMTILRHLYLLKRN